METLKTSLEETLPQQHHLLAHLNSTNSSTSSDEDAGVEEEGESEGGEEDDQQEEGNNSAVVEKGQNLKTKIEQLQEVLLISEDLECPQSKVGSVIGSRGTVIQDIMQRTNCKIMVEQEGQPRIIHITGAFDDVQHAKTLINLVINEGPGALLTLVDCQDPTQPTVIEIMSCPHDKVSFVIGAKGVVIQDIMRRSSCKISVNQDFPPGEPREIVINGRLPQIEIAKSLLQLVIHQGPNALHLPGVIGGEESGQITEELECPHERVGIVIGSKGSIVQEIMKRTGCHIIVHQDLPDGEPRQVLITGTPEQVKAGRALVNAVILNGPMAVQGPGNSGGNIAHEIKLLQSQVGKLIGPAGSIIKDIQQRFSVRMNIDQPSPHVEERKVRITGDAASVHAVVEYVWHLVNNEGGGGGGQSPPYSNSPTSHYGVPAATSPVGSYETPQTMMSAPFIPSIPHPLPPPPSPQAIGQGLGADGSSGRLMPATPLGNGLVHQVVYLLKPLLGRIIGDKLSILQLIMTKSGANVQVEQSPVIATGGQELSRLNIIGAAAGVTLAGQMVQEILINGPEKLYLLPDVAWYEPPAPSPAPAPAHRPSGSSPYQMRSPPQQQYMASYEGGPVSPVYHQHAPHPGGYSPSSPPYATYLAGTSDRNFSGHNQQHHQHQQQQYHSYLHQQQQHQQQQQQLQHLQLQQQQRRDPRAPVPVPTPTHHQLHPTMMHQPSSPPSYHRAPVPGPPSYNGVSYTYQPPPQQQAYYISSSGPIPQGHNPASISSSVTSSL